MKNLFALFLAVALAFSCTPTDPCKDVVCGTSGTCTEGICICDTGYEQDSIGACNIEWSAKFLGANMATADTCYGDNGSFSVSYATTITRTSEVAISSTNLGAFGSTNVVPMDVTSSTNVSLNHTDIGGRIFSGSGSIANNVLSLDYTVTYSDNTVDTCMAMITVQ
jgi:hypothetical protein